MTNVGDVHVHDGDDPLPLPSPAGVPGHDVQFYDRDEFLADTVARFLADGVKAGQPLIVIATKRHRAAFADTLRQMGFDPDGAVGAPQPIWLDARQTLASFMEGAMPNPELFTATVGSVFDKTVGERGYLVARAYGEMVDLLFKDGNIEGAIELEKLWNGLAGRHAFSLLCAYSMGNFYKESQARALSRVCAQHGRVLPPADRPDWVL